MSSHDISPLTRVVARVDRLRDGEVDAAIVPTGFPSLDRAIGGGLRRGDLLVMGGDDGAGCSSLALAIALRVPARAVVLTSEMQPERSYERALAMSARVSLESLRLGVVDEDERTRLAAAAVDLRDRAPIIDWLGDGGVAAVARALSEDPAPEVLVVDGLEALLAAEHAHGPAHDEQIAFAVLALKRLAVQHNVALLLLTHLPSLDRTRHDRRPRLTDFGRRGAIGAHADLVLGLYREEMYDGDIGVTGATELLVLKHRDGPLGYVDLYFYAKWLRFEDVLEA